MSLHALRSPLKNAVLRPIALNNAAVPVSRYTTKAATEDQPANDIATWDDYFKLRKKRRVYELVSCVPSTIAPAMGSISYFANLEIDPFTTFFGMDPVMASALATVGAGFAGFMAGPVVGNLLFKAMNNKLVPSMDRRDKEFYEHIKANRADARLNSIRNPVPDYYGEKIQSVADYRAWLRKQREHYRKGVFGGNTDDLDN
ncbi:mitochondrial import protein Pam17-domain-containing protein [Fennellomyces sp. T-0311]|nr:mitochondrial import protein Pam17-domain-containing protein [Fennellomyces sp. T-0311]